MLIESKSSVLFLLQMLLEIGKVSSREIFVLHILDENEATEKKKTTLYYILSKDKIT